MRWRSHNKNRRRAEQRKTRYRCTDCGDWRPVWWREPGSTVCPPCY